MFGNTLTVQKSFDDMGTPLSDVTFCVIDFETTGISPNMGDRATEVAIVMLEGGQVVDRFESLMNAGVRVNSFITQLTGITNEMVQAAPPAEQVMREAARFVAGRPMSKAWSGCWQP